MCFSTILFVTYIDVNSKLRTLLFSVGDRHCFDAHPEPDQNFYFDADPDREWHQNDAGPYADPAPSFVHLGITEIRFLLTFTAAAIHLGLSCSLVVRIRIRPIRQSDADLIRIHNTYAIIPLVTF
jgi:hypothetical protein